MLSAISSAVIPPVDGFSDMVAEPVDEGVSSRRLRVAGMVNDREQAGHRRIDRPGRKTAIGDAPAYAEARKDRRPFAACDNFTDTLDRIHFELQVQSHVACLEMTVEFGPQAVPLRWQDQLGLLQLRDVARRIRLLAGRRGHVNLSFFD